jgi:signal transduction histidine kinase
MSLMAGQPLENYQLRRRLKDVETAVADIRKLNYQIRRLKQLQGKIQLSAVPLHTLVSDALDRCAARIPGVRKSRKILGECTVCGDPHLLKEALEEVFHNSVRELLHRATPDPLLAVEVWTEGDLGWFSIRDNGLPADERLIEKPFDEDASTYANQGKGTGLGLTIVKETFRSHSGKCFLEPNQDGSGNRIPGVIFKGCLPLWQQSR